MTNPHDSSSVRIEKVEVSVYTVPTDFPEADGTLEWDSTTLVLVRMFAGGETGLGYSYAAAAAGDLVRHVLARLVEGRDAMNIPAIWREMIRQVRNLGRPGIAATAISAVDFALWDLKARLLRLPLAKLFGIVREAVPIYGSGGFTSYSNKQLAGQLSAWVEEGIPRVKMKVGRDASKDRSRVRLARQAIGPHTELFVDANGGYSRKQAVFQAEAFRESGVSWFEEPVTADDLAGLRLVRDRAPSAMEVAAGEYGYELTYFRRMLAAGSVDVLQADATRCGGFTGFLQVAALCQAHLLPLSAHTAPALHVHAGCSAGPLRHIEYFHDHVRIERMLFEGAPKLVQGTLQPDLSKPGMGLELKQADARRFAA